MAEDQDKKPIHSIEVIVRVKREAGYDSPIVTESTQRVGLLTLAQVREHVREIARDTTKRVQDALGVVEVAHDPEGAEAPEAF